MKSKKNLFLLLLVSVVILCSCQSLESTSTGEVDPPTSAAPIITETTQLTVTPNPTPTPRPKPSLNPDSVLTLQKGNDFPRYRFYPGYGLKKSDSNRIGDMFPMDPWEVPCPDFGNDWFGGHIKRLGFKWARISVDYLELEQAQQSGNYSDDMINECHKKAVAFLYDHDITIMHTIVHWDQRLHSARYPDYTREDDLQQYLDYSRMIVKAFKGKIKYYEILNEAYFYVPADVYIDLIRKVIPVIREEDPDAKIVVGGTTDLRDPAMQSYLNQVINSDVINQVDGIAMHPMYGPSPQYDETRQYYMNYPKIIQGIQDTARQNGFVGEFFAEEMVWRTELNPHPYEIWQYSATQAAKYYARGIVINLGLDVWAGIGGEGYDSIPEVVTVVQTLNKLMIGALPDDLSVSVISESEEIVYYTFSYPNGDRMIAIWTDGVAVDDDPGVLTSLSIEDLSVESAIGYDLLYPFSQELILDSNGNSLVVKDLLVRDFPTLIRFTSGD